MPSIKKGFACGSTVPAIPATLVSLHAKWYYNWGYIATPNVSNTIPFVPMVFSNKVTSNPTAMVALKGTSSQPLLCFNEPDLPQQANMTVPKAIASWSIAEKTGRRMGGPATATNPTSTTGWLANFMKAKPAGGVDFMCVHWYGPANAASLLRVIDNLYNIYKKPIWITEFAVADWTTPNKYTPSQVAAFLSAVIPQLESRAYVEKYAWKQRTASDPNMGSSTMVNADGSLTALGTLYASF